MQRIIERVVTVVTTTTWTISWKDDPLPTDPQPGSVPEGFSNPEGSPSGAKHTQQFSSVVTKKEADPAEAHTDTPADEPQTKSHL